MPVLPILSLCIAATVFIDLAIAFYGLARSELFWPLALCTSLGGLSAVVMLLAFLDFEATAAIYAALIVLGAAALVSLLPVLRSVA